MRVKAVLIMVILMVVSAHGLYAASGDIFVKGNAGIGTTSPKAKLDVKGSAVVENIIETEGYVDLAKGVSPTITSGSLAGGGPTFRGNPSNWTVTSFPSSLTLDLSPAPAPQQIQYISFGSSWREDTSYIPKDYSIDYSADGINWTNLVSVQNYSGKFVIHNANGISGRYIRLNVLAPQSGQTRVYVTGLQVMSVQGPAMYGDNPWAARGVNSVFAMPGNVGIGSDPGTYKLYVNGPFFATSGPWSSSDIRFKEDIAPIADSLANVLKLNGVSYKWKTKEYKEKGFPEGRHYGVVAQDIEKVLPEVVKANPDSSISVAYTEIIPVLIEAIKEQQSQIEQLKTEVKSLRNRDSY